jgi:hypothetical protein
MTKDTARAERRGHDDRMKARAKRTMRLWSGAPASGEFNPRHVGRNASTHCRPCSCHLCRNDEPSKRDRIFQSTEI